MLTINVLKTLLSRLLSKLSPSFCCWLGGPVVTMCVALSLSSTMEPYLRNKTCNKHPWKSSYIVLSCILKFESWHHLFSLIIGKWSEVTAKINIITIGKLQQTKSHHVPFDYLFHFRQLFSFNLRVDINLGKLQ